MTEHVGTGSFGTKIGLVLCGVVACLLAGCVEGTPTSQSALATVGHLGPDEVGPPADFTRMYFLPVKFRPIAQKLGGTGLTEISLDGTWRICAKPPTDFQTQAKEGPGWSDFTVPGQWLQQGFDIPPDATAAMARTFTVPPSWGGKQVLLRLEGIHAGTEYWLNGRRVGYSENLFTPVELDITDAVLVGKANRLVLAMKVQTVSETASFSSGYAFHNLGGIDRSVHLFALPRTCISRLHYTTPLDKRYTDAVLALDFSVDNCTADTADGLWLRLALCDPQGRPVRVEPSDYRLEPIAPGENRFKIDLPVTSPRKWNPEQPYLYELTMELHHGHSLLEQVRQVVGFRQVEVKNKQIYLNGVHFKPVGVGRQEVHPTKARAGSGEFGEEDVRLIRQANFNYLRSAHYPPTRQFLEAADRLGLAVTCEAPFCWSGNAGDPSAIPQFMTGTAAMIEAHRNHPSIITWSLDNESPFGCCFVETCKLAQRDDPTRLVISNGGVGPTCDLQAWHYPPFPFDQIPEIRNEKRPTQFDEYIPPMSVWFPEEYERNPGLDTTWSEGQNSADSYVAQLRASTNVSGGAIWGWIDDDFAMPDRTRKGYGQWGFVDAWRRPKGMWWDAKLMHSPVFVPIRSMELRPGQKTVRIPLQNRYFFTDLREVHGAWQLGDRSGTIAMSLPPQATGHFDIPVSQGDAGKMILLRFTDAQGELISAHGVRLLTPGEYVLFQAPPPAGRRTIQVDGTFDDWKDVAPVAEARPVVEEALPPRAGNKLQALWLAADQDNLYVSVRCAGPIVKSHQWSPTLVLLDVDCDDSTGYQASKPLGADYFVQPMSDSSPDVWIHHNSGSRKSPTNQWDPPVVVKDAYRIGGGHDNNRAELRIAWTQIGVADPSKACIRVRVADGASGLSTAEGHWLPQGPPAWRPPAPDAGCPAWQQDERTITVKGAGWKMTIDRATGHIDSAGVKDGVALVGLPIPFLNRADVMNMRSPFRPQGVLYTEYPDPATRQVESLVAQAKGNALEITVRDQFKDFKGSSTMLIDSTGRASISYDYEYTGATFTTWETGMRLLLAGKCQEVQWKRAAEWDVYNEGNIGRAQGTARAHRDPKNPGTDGGAYLSKPAWPWQLDENEAGTRDFRAAKYHVYWARLVAPNGSGMQVDSDGTTTDIRPSLCPQGVELHVLRGENPSTAQNGVLCLRLFKTFQAGSKLAGSFSIKLLPAKER